MLNGIGLIQRIGLMAAGIRAGKTFRLLGKVKVDLMILSPFVPHLSFQMFLIAILDQQQKCH